MVDPQSHSPALETIAVVAGRPARVPDAPLNAPIVPASSFIAGGRMEYAREDAPSSAALEDALGALDGGHAIVFASGMAAVNAVFDLAPTGARIVAPRIAYTGVAARLRELDAAGRIELVLVDVADAEQVARACAGAWLLWLESPTNPLLEVADLPLCIEAARSSGALVAVDSTFATPMRQRPLLLGADLVMHSATKAIGGHSDLLLGVLVARDAELAERLRIRRVLLGAAPGPFDCYLALRGLRTLALRVDRAEQTARWLLPRIEEHPAVSRVRYPGFGTMAAIELADAAAADRLCASTQLWTHATSLGGVESLLERRRRWPLESPLVPESLVRLSFGIEAAEDLLADLVAALDAASRA